MVRAFAEGAQEAGHEVTVIPVGRKKIAGRHKNSKECLSDGAPVSSGSQEVYETAIQQYRLSVVEYYKVRDRGIMTVNEEDNPVEKNMDALWEFGRSI